MIGTVTPGATTDRLGAIPPAARRPPAQPSVDQTEGTLPSAFRQPDHVIRQWSPVRPAVPVTFRPARAAVTAAPQGRAIAKGVWYGTATHTADGGPVRVLTVDPRQARLGATFGTGADGVPPRRVVGQPGMVAAVNGAFFASGVIGDMQGLGRTYRDENAPTGDAKDLDRTSDRRFYLATTRDGQVLTGRGGLSELNRSDIDAFQGGMGVMYTRAQLPNLDTDIASGAFADRIIFRKDRQKLSIARTFAGVTADGRILLVTMSDGKHRSQGAGFTEAAHIMRDLGAVEAYILDGGSSTSMIVPGVVETQTSGGQVKGYLAVYARN